MPTPTLKPQPVVISNPNDIKRKISTGCNWDPHIAIAIALAENGTMEPTRTGHNTNGSVDHGIFQINSVHRKRVGGDLTRLFNVDTNISVACQIWREQGWGPWSTWWADPKKRIGPGKGVYLKHL